MKKVLVDTSIWIEYFRGNKTVQDIIHDTKTYQCFIIGPVLTELLLGIKTSGEKEHLIDCMNVFPTLSINDRDCIYAGNTGNTLRQKGITVPLPDLIIFSTAENNNCALFTLDKHFEVIKNAIESGIEIITCK